MTNHLGLLCHITELFSVKQDISYSQTLYLQCL